jgi:predicted ArsR family transcriptional regulator
MTILNIHVEVNIIVHAVVNNQVRFQNGCAIVKKVYKIQDLEQIRLLSDPLKLKLLQAFAEDQKTVAEVATELGERITKLYRHVDALHAAGLLEITRETPKRGTLERAFRAVARRFEADYALFADQAGDDAAATVRELLQAGQAEIVDAMTTGAHKNSDDFIVTRLRCRASAKRIAELRQSLIEWLESVEQESDDDSGDEQQLVGGLIAFYPLKG